MEHHCIICWSSFAAFNKGSFSYYRLYNVPFGIQGDNWHNAWHQVVSSFYYTFSKRNPPTPHHKMTIPGALRLPIIKWQLPDLCDSNYLASERNIQNMKCAAERQRHCALIKAEIADASSKVLHRMFLWGLFLCCDIPSTRCLSMFLFVTYVLKELKSIHPKKKMFLATLLNVNNTGKACSIKVPTIVENQYEVVSLKPA